MIFLPVNPHGKVNPSSNPNWRLWWGGGPNGIVLIKEVILLSRSQSVSGKTIPTVKPRQQQKATKMLIVWGKNKQTADYF